jgi:hypothetical protein
MVEQTVYELKRTRPTRLDIYRIAYHKADLGTGAKTTIDERARINRAVILPSAAKTMTLFGPQQDLGGGFYQNETVIALVDVRDLPRYWGTPTLEQWCIVDNGRWDIKKVTDFGGRAYAMTLQQVEGGETVRGEDSSNSMILTDEVEVV